MIILQLHNQRILFLTDLALWAAISTLSYVMPENSFIWINQIPFFEASSSYYYSSDIPHKISQKYLGGLAADSPKAREMAKNYQALLDF